MFAFLTGFISKSNKRLNKDKQSTARSASPDLSELELDLTPDFSDISTPDDGRKTGENMYLDFQLKGSVQHCVLP